MDIYDANHLRVNAINDLTKIEKSLLTVAEAAYAGRDEQKLHEARYDIQEAFRTLYDMGRELKETLDASWRSQGEETKAVFNELSAKYPGLSYEWNHDLPHYNFFDRHDLLYLITSTISDIMIHDPYPDRPELVEQIKDMRTWARRLIAIGANEANGSIYG